MGTVVPIKGAREAPKASQNRMETVIVSSDEVNGWRIPPFQRPLRVNQKVMEIADVMKESQCIEGVITLGRISKDPGTYIIDGQHRVEAFRISGLKEVIADIRFLNVGSMAEMADEFVRLNSALVKMRPDDILRGLESSLPALASIRKNCEFVGYDSIRRGGTSPMLSMSIALRCWAGSGGETPASNVSGQSTAVLARTLDGESTQHLTTFLLTAHAAWGRDPEYYRLWGALNLTICMWMWRRLVLDRDRVGNKRYAVLSIAEFKQCLMSVSADGDYISWLPGRMMSDRDRSPCYARLKALFVRRLSNGGAKKVVFPQPAWSSR